MNLWKVKRVRLLTGGWGEWGAHNNDVPTRYFLTHAEALAYADKMARTVEVVLPGEAPTIVPAHNGPQDTPWYTFTSRNEEFYCALTIWGPGGEIGIFDERDLKPLALALLAHYYQQEKK